MIGSVVLEAVCRDDMEVVADVAEPEPRGVEEMRAEILAATAQSRATALIITLLPIVAAVALYFLVQDYFRPMLVNPIGWFMLGLAAFLLFIGNVIIRRLTAIA